MDVDPAQLRVIVTRRPKYACRSCTDGVVQAPARSIPVGILTEATVARVLMDLPRICAAPSVRLGNMAFEGQRAFASQC